MRRLFEYRPFLLLLIIVFKVSVSHAQYRLEAIIVDADEGKPLAGATVLWRQTGKAIFADSAGRVVLSELPAGKHSFDITYTGYESRSYNYTIPLEQPGFVTWQLELAEEEEEDPVIVMATRLSRTLENTPTRMEVISGEELNEKGNMKPGDIRMLLNETTGIQTQQTSATSYNAGIRIQGLEGRYTQLLRDGFPLYGGFAGGLSILQIAPLDLQQVEVIKGASSTLYGGGAIAGLINLVSKTPGAERELSFMGNATSAAGLDLSGFYSERYGKAGVTVFAARNSTRAYDPADIGLTAIPKSTRYTINPRLYLYGQKTTANIGINVITEERTGGNINYIKNGTPGYYEENETGRVTVTGSMTHRFAENSAFT
ncbi:MAG: TonB-dependent receptor, partial [Chitinophagaceae bacterium]